MNFTIQTAEQLIEKKTNNDPECFVNHEEHEEQTIYGTGTAQKVYLRVSEFFCLHPKRRDWTPEGLYKHVTQKHIKKEDYSQISNYWLSVKNMYIAGSKIEEQPQGAFWQKFGELYKSVGKDPKTPTNTGKSPERMESGQFVLRDQETIIDDIIVRRSCKFLLYDSIDRGSDIAYTLDDLDLARVASKAKVEETVDRSGVSTRERKVPICTTELREIFRRWDYFEEHLTFYTNFEACLPPWFTHGLQDWAQYAVHLAGKIKLKYNDLTGQIDALSNLCGSGQYRDVISGYHELNPSVRLRGTFVHLVDKSRE